MTDIDSGTTTDLGLNELTTQLDKAHIFHSWSAQAKLVPLVGGVLSGGLTLSTFLPMAKRLKKHLATLETTKLTTTTSDKLDADDSHD